MAKIQYEDKVALIVNPDIPDINKVTNNNMNEIKQVVNENDDKFLTNGLNISNEVDEDYRVNFIKGKNLYNKSTDIINAIVASDGSLTTAEGYVCSQLIPVKPSSTYAISYVNLSASEKIIRIGYYQQNGTPITRTTIGENATITTQANCYYIRVSYLLSTNKDVQVEEGSTITTYEPYTRSIYLDNEEIFSKDNLEQYSASEIRIGTWIDGKPLYRIVVDFGALPNATQKEVNHNISNLDKIIKVYGTATDGAFTLPIPIVSTTISNNATLFCSATKIGINTAIDRSSYKCYIVLEYTKTTD